MPHEYNVEEILRAKRIARNAGYDVSLPDNKIDIAKNIAREAGYVVREPATRPVTRTIEPKNMPAHKPVPAKTTAPATKTTQKRYRTPEEIAASYL